MENGERKRVRESRLAGIPKVKHSLHKMKTGHPTEGKKSPNINHTLLSEPFLGGFSGLCIG